MADIKESVRKPGHYVLNGTYSADDLMAIATDILEERHANYGSLIADAQKASEIARHKCGHLEHEVFGVIFLTSRHKVIKTEIMFRGSIDRSQVYPRELLKEALGCNAAALVIFHNHPSGNPEPSASDVQLTERLKRLLSEVDVRLLDHLVVGGNKIVTMADRGLI